METLLFCLFTDIITASSDFGKRYYLDKFYGQILWFQIYNDTIANYVVEAEKEEEIELNCGKYSITIKRENLFLEEEFDKFKEHAVNSFCSYYGVHLDQEVVQVSKSGSFSIGGKLTVIIPTNVFSSCYSYYHSSNSNLTVGYYRLVFQIQPQPAACFSYSAYYCDETQLLVPLPKLDETFYAFEKDDTLVGFRPCKPFGMDINVRKEGNVYEITLTHILEEDTDKPITLLRIQIIDPNHHCKIFRTKEEALNSLTL